jgi:hypothetical protein
MGIGLVKTGFGYFEDVDGHIVSKARLPVGIHNVTDGFTYHEVADQAALDAVEIWQDQAALDAAADEAAIQAKMRSMAITALQAEGKLSANFVDKI